MGPFGSVCINKRTVDASLPRQPPPPKLSVVVGEDEGSIALRITFGEHKCNPPTIYYRVQLNIIGTDEVQRFNVGVHDAVFDLKPGRRVQKYRRYQAVITPYNVNGPGQTSDPSEIVYFHHRELSAPVKGRDEGAPLAAVGPGVGA